MSVETLVSQETPVCNAIIRVLEEAGIKMVFGIAGGHTGRIFTALEAHEATIRTVLVREESLAGVMAEVYGRLTRTPGVLMGQGAWVLGNGIIGSLEAFLSSSPMVLLTEFSDTPGFSLHAPYQSGTGEYGAWDARRSFGGITKQVFEALDPVTAVHATQLAIKHALSGQPGPVTVLFGRAGLTGSVSPDSKPVLYKTRHYLPPSAPPADPHRVEAAAKTIAGAAKVVLVAGNGVRVSGAYDALARFADATGIPVTTTATGKGVFPEDHPLAVGPFGTWGIAAANFAVAESDVVIVAGSKLGASDTARENPALLNAGRQTFIQIDVEPRNASWTFPADHVLIGDAGSVLDQLREALGADRERLEAGVRRVAALREVHGYFDEPEYRSEATPILPQRVIGELRRHLPANAIVTCDAGENRILMNHFYQTRMAGGILQAAGAGPMGYAIPAALAVKLVHPDRPVVAVCGDGGFAMTMNGLMTAREHAIPIVVVVFNNRSLGAVAHDTGPYATHFGDFDHAAIARGMGCEGIRIADPKDLGSALRSAVSCGTPTVIDVVTSGEVSFRAAISPPLDK
jgi:acetolactate synthase I/II/III large subunit